MDETPQHPSTSSGQAEMIPKEQYFRLAADFENYRKRMEQEIAGAIKFGNEKLLLEIADVLDTINRAGTDPYDMRPHLEQILKKHDMIRIETTSKPFDPMTMEAVSMADGGESQTVQSEVRAGYVLHERVIRPARVIIYQ